MSPRDRNRDWSVLGAIALIVLGVWLLLDQLPFWQQLRTIVSGLFDFIWPVALILLGVLLLVGANRSRGSRASGKRLFRSRTDRMIGGVLGGLGDYLGVDPTWLRVVYAVAAVISGFGPLILLYIVAMIFVPEEPTAAVQQPVWPAASGTESVQTPPPPPPPAPDPPPPPAPPGTPGA